MNLAKIIKRPIITEKSMRLASQQRYTFEVLKEANKNQIAQAVEDHFNVNVLSVKVTKVPGKTKRFGKLRLKQLVGESKKAIVQTKPDQKIDLFELKEQK
ncbi:50S ribosomal protein L23 [Candidatus Beckwithbacteria bacterium RBG_13_42_9]|uniref:Large ribosomal subunit protein uL23 n=1 Tax=Candidatus Beckwithbacteria bacterium RBG_13_42_9 TaxID=1797457 RepID=A0A1F5E988_9BACT|nr:MAG: 50S ribosomal protein L23 [Candidatus Beckwithbacteria bacterium RBG_13_42_9]